MIKSDTHWVGNSKLEIIIPQNFSYRRKILNHMSFFPYWGIWQ